MNAEQIKSAGSVSCGQTSKTWITDVQSDGLRYMAIEYGGAWVGTDLQDVTDTLVMRFRPSRLHPTIAPNPIRSLSPSARRLDAIGYGQQWDLSVEILHRAFWESGANYLTKLEHEAKNGN